MSTDIRKWINLVEGRWRRNGWERSPFMRFRKDDTWYADYHLQSKFFDESDYEEWEDVITNVDGYDKDTLLVMAKEFFNQHVIEEYVYYRITRLEIVYDEFMWKVEPIKSLDEAIADTWYSDEEVRTQFLSSARMTEWWEAFEYVPEHEILGVAQDTFQKYIRQEAKPAWITDVYFPQDSIANGKYARGELKWKIARGEDDPDEY